jgi:hypothetical protein
LPLAGSSCRARTTNASNAFRARCMKVTQTQPGQTYRLSMCTYVQLTLSSHVHDDRPGTLSPIIML